MEREAERAEFQILPTKINRRFCEIVVAPSRSICESACVEGNESYDANHKPKDQMTLDPKIKSALETAKISRYYLSAYANAEKSTKLDGKLFSTLEEQKRYFAVRRERSAESLRGDLSALRMMCTDLLTKTSDAAARAAVEAQIEALDKEIGQIA